MTHRNGQMANIRTDDQHRWGLEHYLENLYVLFYYNAARCNKRHTRKSRLKAKNFSDPHCALKQSEEKLKVDKTVGFKNSNP